MSGKRGPYKRHLTGEAHGVPDSTYRSQEKKRRLINQVNERLSPDNFEIIRISENCATSSTNHQRTFQEPMQHDIIEVNENEILNCEAGGCQVITIALEESPNISDEEYEDISEHDFDNGNIDYANRDVDDNEIYDEYEVLSDDDDEESDYEDAEEIFYNANEILAVDEDDYADEIEVRHPIYPNCDLTKEESETLLLAQALRYGFSDSALESNINLLDHHLPYDVHGSKYHFLKNFPNPNEVKYYFCWDCCEILNLDNINNFTCQVCGKEFSKKSLEKRGDYFLYIPLKEQLVDLVNSKYFIKFRKANEEESDIINGKYYKLLREQNIIADNDITIQWNTDGISTFKSSKRSIWPILVQINELPYRLRKDHILCCSVWIASKKPPMNMFLKPFINELIKLANEGFESTTIMHQEPIKIKVHTLLSPVDSVARAALQNIHQYNGECGCSYCLIPGQSIPFGKGTTRVYCGDKHAGRTTSQHKHDCNAVVNSNPKKDHVNGVKGPSIIQLLPIFHIIWSFPPEYLHSVCEGVVCLLVCAMFDSKNHKESWYLGLKKNDFDQILLNIKPSSEITRCPRSIEDREKWKGSEWKNFLIYYSLICFKKLMDKEHYDHWFLFVYSIQIFLKEKITAAEHAAASTAIKQFVLRIECLYGKQFMKFNVHILLHIPNSVRNFGALWAWSTFPFEHYNGILKNLFKGTQHLPEQISKFYTRLRYVKLSSSVFSKPNCSVRGKALFQSLMKECKIKRCIQYGEHLRLFGAGKDVNLTDAEQLLIQQVLQANVEEDALCFKRFIFKHSLFHSDSYQRLKKRINWVIQTFNGNFLIITKLLTVKTTTNLKKQVIIGKELLVLTETLCEFQNFSSDDFVFVVKECNSIVAILPSQIKKKCVYVTYDEEKGCVIPLLNSIETD